MAAIKALALPPTAFGRWVYWAEKDRIARGRKLTFKSVNHTRPNRSKRRAKR